MLPRSFVRDRSLAHEILHDWWGNGVFVDRASGNWAEGLTTLMADHDLAGEPAGAAMRLAWLRDFAALPAERDLALSAFVAKEHDAAQVVGYGKAAMVFHMLRDRLGAETFQRGLTLFWDRHRFQEAGWSDLRGAFEAASGADLSVFMDQWLNRPGAPAVCLASAEPTPDGARIVLAQAEPYWDLVVPVVVGEARHLVPLAGARAEALLPGTGAVALDPRHDLFRKLAPGEAPPILRDVTLNLDAAVLAEGDTARELAARLMDGPPRFANAATARPPLAVIGSGAQVEAALARL
ncbi:MAG: M1 family peptidase, partial [Alphaproteobacteria bacterium]|nr:M1 family peptidase [Alphaproteobacteria bacterium]